MIRIHKIPNIQSMALVALKTSQPIAEIKWNRGFFKNVADSKETECLMIHTVQVIWNTKHCLLRYAQDQVREYQNINFQNRFQLSVLQGMWRWRVKLAPVLGNIQTVGVTQKQGISLQAGSTSKSDDTIWIKVGKWITFFLFYLWSSSCKLENLFLHKLSTKLIYQCQHVSYTISQKDNHNVNQESRSAKQYQIILHYSKYKVCA